MKKPFRYFVVIAYDITDDARRTKLANRLLNYGIRVQYSVFEAILSRKEIRDMVRQLRRLIDREEDSVRIYVLTKSTRREIIKLGIQPETEVSETEDVIIV